MDTAAFFTKWLQDLAAEQRDDGLVTNLVPDAFAGASRFMQRLEGSAGWGDAAVIVPWTLYLCFGDRRVLQRQYPSMQAWVDYAAGHAENVHWARRLEPSYWLDTARRARMPHLWDTKYHWGEWLEPGTGGGRLVFGILKRLILSEPSVATAYLAYSSGLLARIAWLLGRQDDADRYQALHERVKAAYVAEFTRPDGRMKPDKQASYARALAFELLPDSLRPAAADRLAELVRKNGNHLGTGFLSTPYLCHVLSQHGHLDVAYNLLYQKTSPSWLYPITKGATTIWESWEGIKKDGSVQMSLNHYSYGAVGSWLHQVVAGLDIDPLAPGYQHILIQPRPGGRLTRARTEHDSPYGKAASGWERSETRMRVEAVVPPNTRATVRLPDAIATQVLEGGAPLAAASGIRGVRQLAGATVCEAGSGQYLFEYPIAPGRWAGARA
jgi:alpha-L-rhamnosidase